jgi:hypothetical protein
MEPNRKRWYADWRVWFCLFALVAWGLAEWILGLPFRLFDRLWSLIF